MDRDDLIIEAMLKKDSTEAKREVYESYVSECIAVGDELKSNVGY